MKSLSASTRLDDPYRAGVALGEALKPMAPEVVFLFGTVHYAEPPELLEGLYDALEDERVLLIGCSGDGFFASREVGDHGVAALGLNSEGRLAWRLAKAGGVRDEPEAALRRAYAELCAGFGGQAPALIYLVSDFRTDATRLESVLHAEIPVPVVGGLAADNNRMERCQVYANRALLEDHLVLLGIAGPLRFDIHIANTLSPVGQTGMIDDAEGTEIHGIGGLSATEFIRRQTGKPVMGNDRGILVLSVVDPEYGQRRRLRSLMRHFAADEASVALYGGIETGKQVQVCQAQPGDLVAEVQAIAERVRAGDFRPDAALVVSCVGRKWLLGTQIEHEVLDLAAAFPDGLPLAGYPSFGEIGPLKEGKAYTPNLFHNMTYILLLLGVA